jgi:hypothetical protein
MQAGLDVPEVSPLDQPGGEMINRIGVAHEPGDVVDTAGGLSVVAGEEMILVGPIVLGMTRVAKRQHKVTARRLDNGDIVAVDTIDLGKAGQRQRLIQQVLEKLALPDPDAEVLDGSLDQRLLRLSASVPASLAPPGTAGATGAEFSLVHDSQNPQNSGLYWNLQVPPAQICNFDMRIAEHVVIRDEADQETRLRGTIRCLGRQAPFDLSTSEFASNCRLKTAIYNAALPGVDFKLGADVLRRAITAISTPAIREVTTATGWTDDRSKFLVPGGFVDASGYHDYDPSAGIAQVDLGACENARWLGMRNLTADELVAVKRHVVEELLKLHERRVMRSLLGAAALAPLRRLAAPKSRPVIWLKGLTGSGKTFASSLLMNFFGAYPLTASERIATWSSTFSYLQMLGFFYRDCQFLIDDFKPQTARYADVVRLLQNYADGTGRGRLRHDASTRVVRPIRGLLIATGEEYPMQNASGLARSIVVEVPNREKDLALGERCLAMSPLYRGMMGDFLAWVIRNGRGIAFADRVAYWHDYYYRSIAGRQNDARIAGNHALLAAAFEQLASYLADVWPEAAQEAEVFAQVDVAEMVLASVGWAEEDQASSIFLETLRALLDWGRVRLEGPRDSTSSGAIDTKNRATVVGRIVAGDSSADLVDDPAVELSLVMALQAVQRSLRQQGKPPLQVSEKTLIAQLEAEGLLLDKTGRPIAPGQPGNKSRQVRIERKRVRVIRLGLSDLLGSDDRAGREAPRRTELAKAS